MRFLRPDGAARWRASSRLMRAIRRAARMSASPQPERRARARAICVAAAGQARADFAPTFPAAMHGHVAVVEEEFRVKKFSRCRHRRWRHFLT